MQHCFAVVGNPVDHSLSPIIHDYFAQQYCINLSYQTMQADEFSFDKQVADFFRQGGKGLNITLPFKQRAFSLAQHTTLRARLAGAANTLWMQDNQLHADNTDGIGLIRDLSKYLDLSGKRILILGAGGAVRGIIHPLSAVHPADLLIANRTLSRAQELQQGCSLVRCCTFEEIRGTFDLVIHATSAHWSDKPLAFPRACLSSDALSYDLSYHLCGQTPFVRDAQAAGYHAVDGLGMLVEQAAESFFIWHGVRPSVLPVFAFLRRAKD